MATILNSDPSTNIACTLLERDYAFGVAALINSLVKSGFDGTIVCGYRGDLPDWLSRHNRTDVAASVRVEFELLSVDGHLANFKPYLLKQAIARHGPDNNYFFFDPDITVIGEWAFFKRWVEGGVALVEDVCPRMPENHPKRRDWRTIYAKHGVDLTYRRPEYANGGFCGLAPSRLDFVDRWARSNEIMGSELGGLAVASLPGGAVSSQIGFGRAFSMTDQDALNAALEAYDGPVALLGPEAMGFIPGGRQMLHAIGPTKPWKRRFLHDAVQGNSASIADLAFWHFVGTGPITAFSRPRLLYQRATSKCSRFLGRFYRTYV